MFCDYLKWVILKKKTIVLKLDKKKNWNATSYMGLVILTRVFISASNLIFGLDQ
jgi:hypothetical protein